MALRASKHFSSASVGVRGGPFFCLTAKRDGLREWRGRLASIHSLVGRGTGHGTGVRTRPVHAATSLLLEPLSWHPQRPPSYLFPHREWMGKKTQCCTHVERAPSRTTGPWRGGGGGGGGVRRGRRPRGPSSSGRASHCRRRAGLAGASEVPGLRKH